MVKDTVITFNNRKYKNEMPHSCSQVLAQDCTPELKFIVLLKRDQPEEQNKINVKIGNMYEQQVFISLLKELSPQKTNNPEKTVIHVFQLIFNSDVDLHPKGSVIIVKVNGVEIPINNLPYQHPTGFFFFY